MINFDSYVDTLINKETIEDSWNDAKMKNYKKWEVKENFILNIGNNEQ